MVKKKSSSATKALSNHFVTSKGQKNLPQNPGGCATKSLQLVEDDAHDGSPRHAWDLKETPGDRTGDFCEVIQQFDTVFCTAHWEI